VDVFLSTATDESNVGFLADCFNYFITFKCFYRFYGLIPEALKEKQQNSSILDAEEEDEDLHEVLLATDEPGPKATIAGNVYVSERDISGHLSAMIEEAFQDLEKSGCVEIVGDLVEPTRLGLIASFYYLQHRTVRLFKDGLREGMGHMDLLCLLTDACEFDGLPVRYITMHTVV
jgi:superfamily II helicase